MMIQHVQSSHHAGARGTLRDRRRSFTLIELLVTITVIAIVAGITAFGVRAVARDMKMSNATNTVVAALDTGRGMALSRGRPVLVVFRPTLVRPGDSRIEIIIAELAPPPIRQPVQTFGVTIRNFERFRPVPGIAPRTLPQGISIAGPFLAVDDELWNVPTDLARTNRDEPDSEPPGRMIGVLFAKDGTVRTKLAERAGWYFWVDINGDGAMSRHPDLEASIQIDHYFEMWTPQDEVCVDPVTYLAIFDYDKARQNVTPGPDEWQSPWDRLNALSEYISEHADRIHFNRYTGVVMR